LTTKLPLHDPQGEVIGVVAISRDISEQKQTEETLKQQAHELGERVKELHCLFQISRLIETGTAELDDIFERTVHLLPAAWQYPEHTCARISLNGRTYQIRRITSGNRHGNWSVPSLSTRKQSAGSRSIICKSSPLPPKASSCRKNAI
jgi:hypothetical protein